MFQPIPAIAQDQVVRSLVVVGVPQSVRFVRSASVELPNGDLIVSSEYRVVLQRVRKIAGEGEVPKRLTLNLFAPHHGSIASEPAIAVVLDMKGDVIDAKDWTIVWQTACFPPELIRDLQRAKEIYPASEDGKMCLKFDKNL
ncbi:MAG: hypothetical protein ABI769_13005 [Pseudomonadota bacterium]